MNQAIDPRLLTDILIERKRQDKKWGGPVHDDTHTPDDWTRYIQRECNYTIGLKEPTDEDQHGTRQRFIRIAALALAPIQSIDRNNHL